MSEGPITTLDEGGFASRHRLLLVLAWAQIPVLAVVGLAFGEPNHEVTFTSLLLIALALGGMVLSRRRPAAIAVALALLTASGTVAHYAGGTGLSHFHFFLMILAISLYRDAVTLSVAVLVTAGYHLAISIAGDAPLSWALNHTGVIAALSVLAVIGWRAGMSSEASDPSGDRFRIAFEKAPIGMAVLKPSGELMEVNRTMSQILGTEPRSLIGANVTRLIHPDDRPDLGEAWEEMGNGATHSATEWMRCLTGDGHPLWARISLTLVPRTEEHPAMVILQLEDATHSYEEQRQLETLLRGKDEFVAAVGDEIKAPLGLLIDLTDVSEHAHVDTRDTLPRIEAHLREIASIVDDLVVSARADTSPVTVVAHDLDAATLCREVVASMPGTDAVSFDFRATRLWADATLTRQIVNNLVGNAIRYGGPTVSLRTVSSGPDTVIQVIDDGPEIPPDERERLFSGDLRSGQPVTRPAAVGLSLTVSRHLARQMDGDVVYRRTGEGKNLFELRLPSEQIREIPRRRPSLKGLEISTT